MPRTKTSSPRTTPGERVRIARAAAGLTQVQLAEAAGLHEITINKIETGRYPLSLRSALKIALATGSPLAMLRSDLPRGGAARCPHCGESIG